MDNRRQVGPKGAKKQYVEKLGRPTKNGVKLDDAPLASRRLTLREMRDCGAWVPLKEEKDR